METIQHRCTAQSESLQARVVHKIYKTRTISRLDSLTLRHNNVLGLLIFSNKIEDGISDIEILNVEKWRALEIWVKGYLRSLEMAPFDRLYEFLFIFHCNYVSIYYSYWDIQHRIYWRDLEIWFRGRSRSLKTVPIDRSYTTLYWSAIVTIALSCSILSFLTFKILWPLKSRLGVIEGHRKWHHSSTYSSSVVTMAVSCIIFEIKQDTGWKMPIFHTPLYLTGTIP